MESKKNWSAPQLVDLMIEETSNGLPSESHPDGASDFYAAS